MGSGTVLSQLPFTSSGLGVTMSGTVNRSKKSLWGIMVVCIFVKGCVGDIVGSYQHIPYPRQHLPYYQDHAHLDLKYSFRDPKETLSSVGQNRAQERTLQVSLW